MDKVYHEWADANEEDVVLSKSAFFDVTQKIIDAEMMSMREEAEEEAVDIPNIDDWVAEQLDILQTPESGPEGPLLQYDDASGTWSNGVGLPVTNSEVEDLVLGLFYDYRDKCPAIRNLWPTDRVKLVLRKAMACYTVRAISKLREMVAYDKGCEEGSRNCLLWVMRDVLQVEEPETAVEVFRQWLWQVKRYLNGMPVPSPLMMNFLGMQGCGKTQFINMLVGPKGLFQRFMTTSSISATGDSREMDMFSQYLVVFFDELAFSSEYGEEARNIDALKKILTSLYNSRRDLGKNTRSKMKRIFSAIAASNTSIVQKLYDPSGMRRYFEIKVLRTERMSQDEHHRVFGEPDQVLGQQPETAMDPLLIWRGIDEFRNVGYLVGEVKKHVEEIQATYKRSDTLEYVLRENDGEIQIPYTGDDDKVIIEEIYKQEFISKARDMLEERYNKVELIRVSAWRKTVYEWCRENDAGQAKYVPRNEGLNAALTKLGYHVFQYGQRYYLLVNRDFEDPEEASGEDAKIVKPQNINND